MDWYVGHVVSGAQANGNSGMDHGDDLRRPDRMCLHL
jgi:hypothetical protein